MADANKIRLSPLDANEIVVTDTNSINLECDDLPAGWEAPTGQKAIGGSNVKNPLTDPQRVNT